MHDGILHHWSVRIFTVKQKLKVITGFHAIELLFKFGKQSTRSKKEGQGIFAGERFYNFTLF